VLFETVGTVVTPMSHIENCRFCFSETAEDSFCFFGKDFQKGLFIPIIRENLFSPYAAIQHMMERTWISKSRPPHEFSLFK
jgi:hypothetical protein